MGRAQRCCPSLEEEAAASAAASGAPGVPRPSGHGTDGLPKVLPQLSEGEESPAREEEGTGAQGNAWGRVAEAAEQQTARSRWGDGAVRWAGAAAGVVGVISAV